MDLLIDTQTLVWIASSPQRLSEPTRKALLDGTTRCFVSAVTAYEYADLDARGRFGVPLPLGPVLEQLDATVLDYPASAYSLAAGLPNLHRDPVDRMLIAHALESGHTLVTADATIRSYPVATLW